MVAVGSWLGYLNFFQAYNNIRFYNNMIDNVYDNTPQIETEIFKT